MRDELSIGVRSHGSLTTWGRSTSWGSGSSDTQELVVHRFGHVLGLLALKVIKVAIVCLSLELTLALDYLDHGIDVLLLALLGQEDGT